MTKSERVVKLLKKQGFKQLGKEEEYIKFTSSRIGIFMYVGNKGALKTGKNLVDSASVTKNLNYLFFKWEV